MPWSCAVDALSSWVKIINIYLIYKLHMNTEGYSKEDYIGTRVILFHGELSVPEESYGKKIVLK